MFMALLISCTSTICPLKKRPNYPTHAKKKKNTEKGNENTERDIDDDDDDDDAYHNNVDLFVEWSE